METHALIGRCQACRGWKSMQLDNAERVLEGK